MHMNVVAITFPDANGAARLLEGIAGLSRSVQSDGAVVLVKEGNGRFAVQEVVNPTWQAARVGPPAFIAGLLLGGTIANELFGEASGPLLANQLDLGIPESKKNELTHDLVQCQSILFMQDLTHLNGTFHRVFDQSGGRLHDLPLTEKASKEVKIITSTLPYYWS